MFEVRLKSALLIPSVCIVLDRWINNITNHVLDESVYG